MNAARRGLPECPPLLASALAKLPPLPGSMLFAAALNGGLAKHLPPDTAALLKGRSFRIHVRDARVAFDFTWTGSRFAALPRQARADLAITASGADFVRMARREEDPDTLFFSRRLVMEGDTELGLVVKNTLDGLELPVLEHLARFAPWRSRGRRGRWG